MSDRKNFSSNQTVTEAQLDDAFADMENADRALARDIGLRGVLDGMTVSPDSPESLILFVDAGTAVSKSVGARIRVPSQQQVDMSIDELGASTIPAFGNERYVALFARFRRLESTPIGPDFGNNFVNFESDEYFTLAVVSGVEAAAGTAPLVPLDADDVLLCDVLLTPTTTQILAGDIDITRAEYTFNETAADPFVIVAQTPVDAIKSLYAKVADIIGGGVPFDAGNIKFTGTTPSWANATNVTGTTPVPANTVENYIEGIVGDLAASVDASDSGAARIGSFEIAEPVTGGNIVVLATGNLRSQLQALTVASSIYVAAAGDWADGTPNPAQSLQARINTSIIQRLASKTDASANGARYIGVDPSLAYFDSAQTIGEVFTKLNAVASAGNNGAARIGFYQTGDLATGSLYSAIVSLESLWGKLSRAQSWTGQQTLGGGLWVGLDSRVVRRVHRLGITLSSGSTHATFVGSDLSTAVNGYTYAAPCILTDIVNADTHWHMSEIDRPLDGNTLTAVELETNVVASDWGLVTVPRYDVIRWKVETSGLTMESLRSGGLLNDDHTSLTDNTVRVQSVTCDQNNVIDTDTWNYALLVRHPYNGDGILRQYSLRSYYSAATTLRHG